VLGVFGRCAMLVGSDGLLGPFSLRDAGEVSAVASSPCGRFVLLGLAAGAAGRGRLLLLSAPSGSVVTVLSESVRGGVSSLGFAPDGLTAACLSRDRYHSLRVFRSLSGQWRDALQLGPSRQVSPLAVEQLVFLSPPAACNPLSAAGLGHSLVTAGEGQLRWWAVSGLNLTCCGPDMSTAATASSMGSVRVTALTSLHGDVIAGDTDGHIFVWQVRAGRGLLPIGSHGGRVSALRAFTDGFVSASCDSLITWQLSAASIRPDGGPAALSVAARLVRQFALPILLSQIGKTAELYKHRVNPSDICKPGTPPPPVQFVTSLSVDPQCRRILLATSASVCMALSADSGRCEKLGEGHGGRVLGLLALPWDPLAVLTLCADGAVRVWDLSRPTLAGSSSGSALQTQLAGVLRLEHSPSAMAWLPGNAHRLLVAVSGADADGASTALLELSVEPSSSGPEQEMQAGKGEFRYQLAVSRRQHNLCRGSVRALQLSLDGGSLLACGDDGCVHVFLLPHFSRLGQLSVYPEGPWQLAGADYSLDSRFVRTFSEPDPLTGKVDVNLWDMLSSGSSAGEAGQRVSHPLDLENQRDAHEWVSCSSAAAPEVRAVSYEVPPGDIGSARTGRLRAARTTSVSVSRPSQGPPLVCAGYGDGGVQVFAYPALEVALDCVGGCVHARGPVFAVFASCEQGSSRTVVSVGALDGVLAVWRLTL